MTSSTLVVYAHREATLIIYGMYWQMSFVDQMKYFDRNDVLFGCILVDILAGQTTDSNVRRLRQRVRQAITLGLDVPEGVMEAL